MLFFIQVVLFKLFLFNHSKSHMLLGQAKQLAKVAQIVLDIAVEEGGHVVY